MSVAEMKKYKTKVTIFILRKPAVNNLLRDFTRKYFNLFLKRNLKDLFGLISSTNIIKENSTKKIFNFNLSSNISLLGTIRLLFGWFN
jgi:hypothetical protein